MTDDEIDEQRAKILEEQNDPIFNPPMPEAGPDGMPMDQTGAPMDQNAPPQDQAPQAQQPPAPIVSPADVLAGKRKV
jgi:hypothetical protein